MEGRETIHKKEKTKSKKEEKKGMELEIETYNYGILCVYRCNIMA